MVWSGYFREKKIKGNVSKQKVMQGFTDISVPCEFMFGLQKQQRKENSSKLKWVRMTLFKDNDLNSSCCPRKMIHPKSMVKDKAIKNEVCRSEDRSETQIVHD